MCGYDLLVVGAAVAVAAVAVDIVDAVAAMRGTENAPVHEIVIVAVVSVSAFVPVYAFVPVSALVLVSPSAYAIVLLHHPLTPPLVSAYLLAMGNMYYYIHLALHQKYYNVAVIVLVYILVHREHLETCQYYIVNLGNKHVNHLGIECRSNHFVVVSCNAEPYF